jgi:hypothetical protein
MQGKSLTETQAKYRAYLRTAAWRQKREAALERADRRCQICNSAQRLDAHHRTYERIYNEQPNDLTVLCRKCHDLFHHTPRPKYKKRKPLTGPERTLLLQTVEKHPGLRARDLKPYIGRPISWISPQLKSLGAEGVLRMDPRGHWFPIGRTPAGNAVPTALRDGR